MSVKSAFADMRWNFAFIFLAECLSSSRSVVLRLRLSELDLSYLSFPLFRSVFVKTKSSLAVLIAVGSIFAGCKPRSFNSGVQSSGDSSFAQQFEVTRFAVCKDSKGKEAGGFDFVWRLKRSSGESVTPYILGFAGSLESTTGQKFEFRSVTTIDEPRYRTPELKPSESFPVMSYIGYSLQYPEAELKSGWGYQRVNGTDYKFNDITGATLTIPKSKDAGAFANRYFIITSEGKTFEFNCQSVSDVVRERMKTYLVADGSHGFKGDRGPVVSATPKPLNAPTASANPAASNLDLRPAGRPASYDAQFRHERIYNCGASGAVDVIWRKANSNGAALAAKEQYILGFAAKLSDYQTKKELAFSSVSVDSAPAFSTGEVPSPSSYLSPMFVFDEGELKSKLSWHSPIPGLSAGRVAAAGGTLWVPYDGSGNGVSVAIALGPVVRGPAHQVIADCTPAHPKVREWITGCVGRQSVASCVR